jgi:hypothetical protein
MFKQGTSVIALRTVTNNEGVGITKGEHYIVGPFSYVCVCGISYTDLNIVSPFETASVCKCGNVMMTILRHAFTSDLRKVRC